MGMNESKSRGDAPVISDDDLKKYTGKTRDELDRFADSTPGVGRNRVAGTAATGPTSGVVGAAMADGVGGWGPESGPNGPNRGLKFPPPCKEVEGIEKGK